jgi:hypothetical protein
LKIIHRDYLGDGVYALFDGYAIWLKANDMSVPSDEICLEPKVVRAFYRFAEHCESLEREEKC